MSVKELGDGSAEMTLNDFRMDLWPHTKKYRIIFLMNKNKDHSVWLSAEEYKSIQNELDLLDEYEQKYVQLKKKYNALKRSISERGVEYEEI